MNKTLHVIFFFILSLTLYSCDFFQEKKGNITSCIQGHIVDLKDSSVILEEWKINEIVKVDEVPVQDGRFTFNTKLITGSMYLLKLDGYKLPLIIDNDSIYISGTSKDINGLKIQGSPASSEILQFTLDVEKMNTELAYYRLMHDSLSKVSAPDSLVKLYLIKHDQGLMEMSNLIKSFADSTTYFQAAMFSIRKLDPNTEVDFFERFIGNLTKRFPSNESAVAFVDMMKNNISNIQKTGVAVGEDAPDFTLRNMENDPVNLSEFRGDYVLLTFWASWCPPCRHENKSMVQVYDSFSNKNFKMIHVSIDKDMGKLKRAIGKDGLKWIMLNDPYEWESNIVNLYGLHKIPSNYLIDPEGKIIAKNLFGNELMKYIYQLYNPEVTKTDLN